MISKNIPIKAWDVVLDTFTHTLPIYFLLLLLYLPTYTIPILVSNVDMGIQAGVVIFSGLGILPVVFGLGVYNVHRRFIDRRAKGLTLMKPFGKITLRLIVLNFIVLIAILLGLILFIFPGIYLSVRLSLAETALIIEGRSPIDALKRSWQLTRGHWWGIFKAHTFFNIMLGVFTAVPYFILVFVVHTNPDTANHWSAFLIAPFAPVFYARLFLEFN